jgi:hypothetical protein
MAKVAQEIGLLDEQTFEGFVHQVLIARYPSAEIKKVEGSGGDQGIDCFSGMLASGPAVWQAKRFASRLGPDQKKQILSSIQSAFKSRVLSEWTLCISIDFRTPEHEWFQQNIVIPYSGLAKISLVQNSDLVRDVSLYRNLTDLFFPDTAISNLLKLRDEIGGKESKELLQQRIDNFLDKASELDPRLDITMISNSFGFSKPFLPESVFSLHHGRHSLHFFPKDKDALAKDPITLTCSFRPEVQPLLERALDTGENLKISAGSLLGIKFSSPLLQSLFPTDTSFLEFETASPPMQMMRDFFFRIVTGKGRRTKEIMVRCKTTKWGRKEFTLQGEISGLTVTIRIERDSTRLFISFKAQFENRDVRDIRKALDFLYPLEETGKLEIYDLETQTLIYTQNHPNMPSIDKCFSINADLKETLDNALKIANYFDVKMILPKYVSQQEIANLKIAAVIIREGKGSNIQLATTLLKSRQHELRFMNAMKSHNIRVRLHQHRGEELNIFGIKLNTKPLTFSSNSARCENSDELIKQYLDAAEGSTIPFILVCDEGGFSFDNQGEDSSLCIADEEGSLSLPIL